MGLRGAYAEALQQLGYDLEDIMVGRCRLTLSNPR